MIVVFNVLNALADALGVDAVLGAVRAWVGKKDAEIFLAENPGLRFGNEGESVGLCPTPSVCADGSCACIDDGAAPSGGGAGLGATMSSGGAALCHTANSKGRYSMYSGIADLDINPYDAPTPEDTAAVAQALIDLSTASASDDASIAAATQAFAGLSMTPRGT